jgi:hypothetical protein
MRVVACLLLLLAVPAVQAQMYKCKDERGRWVFSDKPLPGCAGAPEVPAAKPPAKSAAPQSPPSAARKAPPPSARLPLALPGFKGPAPKKKAVPAGATRQASRAPTEYDKKYARSQCRTLREEEAWLANPRNAGLEARDARLGQVRQALADCR